MKSKMKAVKNCEFNSFVKKINNLQLSIKKIFK